MSGLHVIKLARSSRNTRSSAPATSDAFDASSSGLLSRQILIRSTFSITDLLSAVRSTPRPPPSQSTPQPRCAAVALQSEKRRPILTLHEQEIRPHVTSLRPTLNTPAGRRD